MYSVHIQINSTNSDQDPKMRRKHQNKNKKRPPSFCTLGKFAFSKQKKV